MVLLIGFFDENISYLLFMIHVHIRTKAGLKDVYIYLEL